MILAVTLNHKQMGILNPWLLSSLYQVSPTAAILRLCIWQRGERKISSIEWLRREPQIKWSWWPRIYSSWQTCLRTYSVLDALLGAGDRAVNWTDTHTHTKSLASLHFCGHRVERGYYEQRDGRKINSMLKGGSTIKNKARQGGSHVCWGHNRV